MSALKIVSLLPAATEIICAFNLDAALVGHSHACDYPTAVKALPVCTSSRLNAGLETAENQGQVGEFLTAALSVYVVDLNKLRALSPDIVITQTRITDSATSLADIENALMVFLGKPVQVISFQPDDLAGVFDGIRKIAHQLQVAGTGEELLESLQERLDLIRHKLKFADHIPTVAAINGLNPLKLAGNWVPDLIGIAGGRAIFSPADKDALVTNWEAIRLADPQVLILVLSGHSIPETLQQIDLVMQWPGFEVLTALKSNHFYIADGNQYFNRPGPRVVDTAEMLAEMLHPKQFIFGYEGEGWIRFES